MRTLSALAVALGLGCSFDVEVPRSKLSGDGNPAPTAEDPSTEPPGRPTTPATDPSTPSAPAPEDPTTPEPNPREPSTPEPDPEVPGTPDPAEPALPTMDAGVAGSASVVAAARPGDQCVTVTTLADGAVTAFPTLCSPRAMAATSDGRVFVLDATGRGLWVVSPEAEAPTQVAQTTAAYTGLVLAQDAGHAVLATLPTTPAELVAIDLNPSELPRRQLAIVDLTSGDVETYLTAYAVRDVDVTATRVVVTMGHYDVYGFPEAVLQLFDRDGLAYLGQVVFPNCADDLQIAPGERLAVLAPRTCALHDVVIAQPEVVENWQDWDDVPPNGDPISFVDLEALQHLANVPGFGPAAFAPDGAEVAGFTMQETLMTEWNLFPEQPFGIVIASPEDYTFQLFEAGDVRPSFAYGGDGALYVAGSRDGEAFLARADAESGALVPLQGPWLPLGRAVRAPEGLVVAADGQAWRVDGDGATTLAGVDGDVVTSAGGRVVITDRAAGVHRWQAQDGAWLAIPFGAPAP